MLGDREHALPEAEAALRLNPDHANCYLNVAFSFLRLNRRDEARRVLQEGFRRGLDAPPSGTGRTSWVATTRKVGPCWNRCNVARRLWKSRCVENQKQVFHSAWKSRKGGGIPTFPQPRRRVINTQPDTSLATKTGRFNLLTTVAIEGMRQGTRHHSQPSGPAWFGRFGCSSGASPDCKATRLFEEIKSPPETTLSRIC
jgi:hypothetical protein